VRLVYVPCKAFVDAVHGTLKEIPMAEKKAAAKKTAAKKTATKAAPAAAKTAEEKAPAKATAKTAEPSHAEIAKLAHKFWQERGGHHGNAAEDWTRAERQLRGEK
jgi:hypothetical protein